MDLLIAPCPATGLAHLVRDRIAVSHLRGQLKELLGTLGGLAVETENERASRQTCGAWSDDAILSVARTIMGTIAQEISGTGVGNPNYP